MAVRRWTWACGLLGLGALVGCGRTPARPPGTGAKEAAQGYFEVLLRQDWQKAYSALHPTSRSRLSAGQFARLAQKYRSGLGFEPEAVHVRAWDERDEEATIHVALTGKSATKSRRYKDAIRLRRSDDGWGILLPPGYGRATGR